MENVSKKPNVIHGLDPVLSTTLYKVSNAKCEPLKVKQNHLHSIKSEIFDSVETHFSDSVFYQMEQTPDGKVTFNYLSKRMKEYVDAPWENIISHPELAYSIIQGNYKQKLLEAQAESYQKLSLFNIEFPITDPYGRTRWLHLTSAPEKKSDGTVIWNGIQRDITNKKQEDILLEKSIRELNLLNTVNDLILKADNEEKLIDEVLDLLLHNLHYNLIWACNSPDKDSLDQTIKPLFAKGATGYLNEINIDLNNSYMRTGPTANVLYNGTSVVTNKLSSPETSYIWKEQVIKYGIGSALVVPFRINNKPGAMTIYSPAEDGFDAHESEVMARVASNLLFGIEGIRKKDLLEKKSTDLSQRINELRCLYQINAILTAVEIINDNVLQEITETIPQAFLYPEYCTIKISFDDKIFSTQGIPNDQYKLIQSFDAAGHHVAIQVCYQKTFPNLDEGPFLREERQLLEAIANLMTQHFVKSKAIKELVRTKANLTTVFSSAGISFAILDTTYHVLMLNEEFNKSFFINTGNLIKVGDSFTQLVSPERLPFVIKELDKVRRSEVTHTSFIVESSSNGTKHFMQATYYPITINETLDAILIVGLNVTEEKRLEIERIKIIEDLSMRNTDLQQFTHIVSHNLRAPVANIIGLTRLLKEEIVPETEKTSILGRIEHSSLRLDEVVQDLNKIIQIRREINEIRQEIDFKEVIQEVIDSISFQIHELKARITFDIVPSKLILNTVKSYFISIFYNLISNSLKYSHNNTPPEITIYARKKNGQINIVYTDNGLGIDLNDHGNKVFGLYQRFHLHKEGKGIGLYLTKTQIEALGGTIQIESKVNKGIQFKILLPVEI